MYTGTKRQHEFWGFSTLHSHDLFMVFLLFSHVSLRWILEAILARLGIYFGALGDSQKVIKMSSKINAKLASKKVLIGSEDVRLRKGFPGWWPGWGVSGEVNLPPGKEGWKEERKKIRSEDLKKGLHDPIRRVGGLYIYKTDILTTKFQIVH